LGSRDLGADRRGVFISRLDRAGGPTARQIHGDRACVSLWDGRVVALQVSDAKERTVELRALVSARNASAAWDLRCEVRERLIAYLQAEYPEALPRTRAEVVDRSMERRAGPPVHTLVPED
jgi:hypothetical protein